MQQNCNYNRLSVMSVFRRQRNDRANGCHQSISVHAVQSILLAFNRLNTLRSLLYVFFFCRIHVVIGLIAFSRIYYKYVAPLLLDDRAG